MAPKAVGFDYGGVIGGVKNGRTSFNQQVRGLLGIDRDTHNEAYFSLNHKINLGEIASWPEFWKPLLEKLGKSEYYDRIVALGREEEASLSIIDQRMLELIDALRQKGYKTGLLSNTTLENARRMQAQGLPGHFDAFLISSEIKLMKPDPRAFARLARDLDVQMGELVFIDDKTRSLSTATECGFVPVPFTTYEDLKARLEEMGLL